MPTKPIQILGESAKYLLLALVFLYLMDFSIFQFRRGRGNAMGTVSVDQYLQTPLKGNKAEYDYLGTANQSCSHTLFPQYAASQWNTPCWWLQRHNAQWQ